MHVMAGSSHRRDNLISCYVMFGTGVPHLLLGVIMSWINLLNGLLRYHICRNRPSKSV